MSELRKQKSTNLRRNPFVPLPDEPDYLSETIIEEKEQQEKERQAVLRKASERQIEL